MKRRKRKGRVRWNRIFMTLFTIIVIINTIRIINYFVYNNKIYNSVVESSAKDVSIKQKYKTLKLYNKTIDLIKTDNVSIVINGKKTNTYLEAQEVKQDMDIRVKTYNKKLDYQNFPKIKSFFIENTGIVSKATKVEVYLPRYLTNNKVVDIYGVRSDNTVSRVSPCVSVKDKVTLKPNKKYERYFITFIKLEDIKISNSTVSLGSIVNLNVKYVPENATVKDYEYINIGDIFMLNTDNKIVAKKAGTDKITIKHITQDITKTATITVKEEKQKIENKNGLTYVEGILIANKSYSLPKDYDPGKLSDEVSSAFEQMKEDALKDNIELWIQSGYRSYKTQEELYNRYVEEDGKEKADTYSARPGHSEHQTGLAMDINIIDESFEGTPEAIWIEKNSYKYGFIVRYPKGKEHITGYMYEPWHLRYVGKDIAKKIYDSNLTLEEYLGIDSKYKK